MLLVIGTYRKRAYIERALTSIKEHVTGVDRIVFVDDSNDPEHSRWLTQYGDVSQTLGAGYNTAMQEACRLMSADYACWWEEDFEALAPIDLDSMAATLTAHPELAQLALLRGPHFPIEHEHGGLLEGLVARLGPDTVDLRQEPYGWSQLGTFTGNPSVWAPGVAAQGWPTGRWSEDRKRDHLTRQGYRFGYLDGVKVRHDGERSGHSY